MKELINRVKNVYSNKKLLRIIWTVCLVLFVVLFLHIMKYRQMKIYYNGGVNCFRQGDYTGAELYFKSALWEKHTMRQECSIRINEALSIVTPITPESITSENIEENIARLEEARDILTENNCAHTNDDEGHSKQAQRLKNEIDEYIELLKQSSSEPEEPDENKDQMDEEKKKELEEQQKLKEEEEKKAKQIESELKEKYNQIEQQGLAERNQQLEEYEQWGKTDYYFSGKRW